MKNIRTTLDVEYLLNKLKNLSIMKSDEDAIQKAVIERRLIFMGIPF